MKYNVIESSKNRFHVQIYCKAVPKARPRFSRNRVYTPQKTVQFEKVLRYIFTKEFKNNPWSGEVSLQAFFHYKAPKSKLNRLKTTRPDLDNLIKSVKDAANEIIYCDDGQVACILSWKNYREEDSITLKFEVL